MSASPGSGAIPRERVRARVVAALAAAALIGIALAGCGSSSTASKPQYCADQTNLQNSLHGLTNLNSGSGLSGLQAQITQIKNDSSALVASASSDFPTESSAVQSAANAVASSLQNVKSSPSAADIAVIGKNVANLSTALQNFTNATKSKCS